MGQGRSAVVVVVAALVASLVVSCSKPSAQAPAKPASLPHAVATPDVQTIDEAHVLLQEGKAAEYDRALESLASSADPTTRKRALALHGLRLHEEKRDEEAVPVLKEAAALYPEVAPFLLLRVIEAEETRGDFAGAAAAAATVIALGDSSATTMARLRLPALHARLGDEAATDASWKEAMAIPVDELTEPDFVQMANALAAAGRTDLASSTRMRLLDEYTQGRFTEQTYGLVKSEVGKLPVEQKIALASKLARANRYDQALDLLAQIPESTAEARTVRLRALFNSRNYTRLLDETPPAKLEDASLLLLRARAAWRADRAREFLSGLESVEKRFPKSREAAEAKVLRSKYYITDVTDYAKSIENLSKAIDAGAAGSDGENLWNLGWTYLLAGRDADALKTFARYIDAYPDGDWKTNSLFWSAKILDRLGRTEERNAHARRVIDEYPYSYYAYRAKERWGVTGSEGGASTQSFPDVAAALASIDEPRLAAVRELLEIDLHRAAAREMKVLAAKHGSNPGVQFMLADVYVRAGETLKANGVLQREFRPFVRHGGRGIPDRFWQILFPLPYWPAIRTEALRRELDPYLVASIIRQESLFEPTTVSSAGAVGLMQIMPQEAGRIAAAAGLGAVTRQSLFDPQTNIAVGAAEFAQKLATMQGNPVLAIASYNAGQTAVERWLARTPLEDVDRFVESIPYAETRLYVKIVTRNRSEYRRIYENAAIASR